MDDLSLITLFYQEDEFCKQLEPRWNSFSLSASLASLIGGKPENVVFLLARG